MKVSASSSAVSMSRMVRMSCWMAGASFKGRFRLNYVLFLSVRSLAFKQRFGKGLSVIGNRLLEFRPTRSTRTGNR
jgi:hypothetical protein